MRTLLAALLAAPLWAAPSRASRLAGLWLKDAAPFAELKADGTGRMDEDGVRWKDDGKSLRLTYEDGESEAVPYVLQGDRLTLNMDGETVILERAGKAGKAAPARKGAPPSAAPSGPSAQPNGDLARLLGSSAWCHFRYNQASGASHTERVVFRADGSWISGSRAETYSSGPNGSVAGQRDGAGGGRWLIQGGRLFMSNPEEPVPQDVGLEVSRNSNGYPILKTDGKEYSSCD